MSVPIDQLVQQSVRCNRCGASYGSCLCWSKSEASESLPVATHSGSLQFGEFAFGCHVLSNGQRVLDPADVEAFIEAWYDAR